MKQQNKAAREYMRERDIEALNHVLSTELGRWFFCGLLERTKAHASSYTGNAETYYNEGKRSIGIAYERDVYKIGNDSTIGIDLIATAQKEYVQKKKEFIDLEQKG